jgi:hypothetical protein
MDGEMALTRMPEGPRKSEKAVDSKVFCFMNVKQYQRNEEGVKRTFCECRHRSFCRPIAECARIKTASSNGAEIDDDLDIMVGIFFSIEKIH